MPAIVFSKYIVCLCFPYSSTLPGTTMRQIRHQDKSSLQYAINVVLSRPFMAMKTVHYGCTLCLSGF